jgi:hypothetical protein
LLALVSTLVVVLAIAPTLGAVLVVAPADLPLTWGDGMSVIPRREAGYGQPLPDVTAIDDPCLRDLPTKSGHRDNGMPEMTTTNVAVLTGGDRGMGEFRDHIVGAAKQRAQQSEFLMVFSGIAGSGEHAVESSPHLNVAPGRYSDSRTLVSLAQMSRLRAS